MAPRQKPVVSLKKQRKQHDVDDWVYRFLGNLAAVDSTNVYKMHRSMSDEMRRGKAGLRRVRSPTPYSWAQVTDRMDSDEEIGQSLPPSNSRSRTCKAPITTAAEAADQRTLLERINHYIRAGIAEGKRRAKRYVRKALSFALETGYLLPADREGKLLRVAPSLVHAVKPVAARKASLAQAARLKPGRGSRKRRDNRFSRTWNEELEAVDKKSKSSRQSNVQPRKSWSAHAGGSPMNSNKEATDGAVKPAMRVDSGEVDRKPPLPVT